ncbi:hypothetical protein FRC03_010506 [Tulasnella sp. 419]|nr:hypothetical protein FRC03_010506 [Tulasnella sp. 419]
MVYPLFQVTSLNVAEMDYRDGLKLDLALMHNVLIRSLNSIINHAPRITPANQAAFLVYIQAFHDTCKVHMDGQETKLFPDLEAKSNAAGIKWKAVDDPARRILIADRLRQLHDYIEQLKKGPEVFNHLSVINVINQLAETLLQDFKSISGNLEGERLKSFVSHEELTDIAKQSLRWVETHSNVTIFLPFLASHHDKTTNAFWPGFPPLALEAIPKFTAMNPKTWEFAPFNPVTGAPQ